MLESYHRRTKCRQCGSKDLSLAIKLSPTPLANAYLKTKTFEERFFILRAFAIPAPTPNPWPRLPVESSTPGIPLWLT